MEQITVDMMPEQLENELNNELLPGYSRTGDVASLAGELEFEMNEIDYICSKKAPFKFLLDQWCKRDRKKATFQKLSNTLLELSRPDLAERINETVLEMNEASYEKLELLVNVQDERYKRRDDDKSFDSQNFEKVVEEKSPKVYFVYLSEDQSNESLIEEFANDLRREFAIDVVTNMSSKEYLKNRQVFVLNNLIKADFVLIFCNSALSTVEKNRIGKILQPSQSHKELMFCLHYILKDVFRRNGINRKYIPMLTDKTQSSFIPKALISTKRYTIPLEKEDLVRRIFGVENVELPSVPKERKKFFPRIVSH